MSGYWSKLWRSKRGWVTLSANFRRQGGRPPTTVGIRELRILGLSCGIVCLILHLAVLIQYRHVQTETQRWQIPAYH